MIFDEFLATMNLIVCRLVFQYNQIFRAVVDLDAVDVMDALTRFKQSAKHLFGDQPVFVDIAISISSGVVRGIGINIATFVRPAAALPVAGLGASLLLALVALDVAQVVTSAIAALWDTTFSQCGFLTATTHTQSGGIWGFNGFPAGSISSFGRFGSGPVAVSVLASGGDFLAATA